MTNKEAIEILTKTSIFLSRRNGKHAYLIALTKAIKALIEKDEREQKAKALKEQHKHKCRDCENFCFAYGGLSTTLGHCAIRDKALIYTDSRKASNRACKDFISIKEVNDNED